MKQRLTGAKLLYRLTTYRIAMLVLFSQSQGSEADQVNSFHSGIFVPFFLRVFFMFLSTASFLSSA